MSKSGKPTKNQMEWEKHKKNVAKKNEEKKTLSDEEVDAILSLIEGKSDKVILAILAESSAKVLEKYLLSTQKTLDNIMSIKGEGQDSLLHLAAKKGNQNLLGYLAAKVNLELKNKYGETPLHSAISARSFEVAELLIKEGADVNARDKEGRTALHIMSEIDNAEAVKGLISKGADVNAQDNKGKTPLICAVEGGNIEYVEILINAIKDLPNQEKIDLLNEVVEARKKEPEQQSTQSQDKVMGLQPNNQKEKTQSEQGASETEARAALQTALARKYVWTNTGVKEKAKELFKIGEKGKLLEGFNKDNLEEISGNTENNKSKSGKVIEAIKGLGGLRKTDKEMIAEISKQFDEYTKNPSKQITLPKRYNLPNFGKKSDKGQIKQ